MRTQDLKEFWLKLFPRDSLLHNGKGKTQVLSGLFLFQLDEETLVTHQTSPLGAPSATGCPPDRYGLLSVKTGYSMTASQQTSHYVNLRVCVSIYKLLHLTECLTCQLFSNCIVLQCTHILLHTQTHTLLSNSRYSITCWSSLIAFNYQASVLQTNSNKGEMWQIFLCCVSMERDNTYFSPHIGQASCNQTFTTPFPLSSTTYVQPPGNLLIK